MSEQGMFTVARTRVSAQLPTKKGDHSFVRVPYPQCPSNQFYNETK